MVCFLSSAVYYLLPTVYNIVLYFVFYYLHNSSSRQQAAGMALLFVFSLSVLYLCSQSLFGLSYRKNVSEEEGNPAKSL
jgi:predicted membrane channel-forming protein YqfA (hemolysin III family)